MGPIFKSFILSLSLCLVLPLQAQFTSPFALRVERGGEGEAAVTVTVPQDHVLYSDFFKVTGEGGAKLEISGLPPPALKPDPVNPGEKVSVFTNSLSFRIKFPAGTKTAGFTLDFQGCDKSRCFMPESHSYRLEKGAFIPHDPEAGKTPGKILPEEPVEDVWARGREKVTVGGYLGTQDFIAFLDKAEGRKTERAGGLKGFLDEPMAFFREYGIGMTLLLVLLGGLLLNFTPCVLPMIPINLAIIGAGSVASGKGRGFLLGGSYGLGMTVAYGGLGWLFLKSGLFMGSIQASPLFNGAVALLFLFFALALFGVINIDFTRFSKHRKGNKGGVWPAFAAGAFSAILAGACVAPVVLAVLVLAGALVAEGYASAQFLPFALGLGMALPWPFAGAGLSVLPKPGMWMNKVKTLFALILVILAGYYSWVAVSGLLARRTPDQGVERSGSGNAMMAGDKKSWDRFMEQGKREGRPIFVDFWATWCKNCAAMEKTTFRDKVVRERLGKYLVVRVQAEDPSAPEAKEMLEAFGILGLPGFAILKERQR